MHCARRIRTFQEDFDIDQNRAQGRGEGSGDGHIGIQLHRVRVGAAAEVAAPTGKGITRRRIGGQDHYCAAVVDAGAEQAFDGVNGRAARPIVAKTLRRNRSSG